MSLKGFFKSVNRTIPDASRREAKLPEGAKVLYNPCWSCSRCRR